MRELAGKLRQRTPSTEVGSFSAILGTVSSTVVTNAPRFRIGIWPIQSENAVESAMGIAAVLAFLLERWQNTQVYRLFAQLEGDPKHYHWTIERSQFGVDDWEMEGLDENIAIWGRLSGTYGEWILNLEIENDLLADEHVQQLIYQAPQLGELVNQLPTVAQDIANYLELGAPASHAPLYTHQQLNESTVNTLLVQAFYWELHLLLNAWGRGREAKEVLADEERLLTLASELEGNFGIWVASNSIARGLSPVFQPVNDFLLPTIEQIVDYFESNPIVSISLAAGLYWAGHPLKAYEMLEALVDQYADDASSWVSLAELYWQGGEYAAALNTFQRAIRANIRSASLYTRYADILAFLDANDMSITPGARHRTTSGRAFIEEYILINPSEKTQNQLLWEVIKAYQAALEIDPDQPEVIAQLIVQQIDLGGPVSWNNFQRLIQQDRTGDFVRMIVDAWYNLEDTQPGIELLQKVAAAEPDRYDLHLNLAVAYINSDLGDKAKAELMQVQKLSSNPAIKSDAERLMLSADDPEFEARLGEITDIINSENQPGTDDVEFLENAIESAPSFAPGYTLLAGAYLAWGETDDALEVLLDGQKHLPTHPDILYMLSRVLIDAGEDKLAIESLNKGIEYNPNHVPLLALAGRYMFDAGNEGEARELLAHAEAIDPRHPILMGTRVYIARQLEE